MGRGKLDSFTGSETRFVAEQIGVPDNEFKEEIVNLFRDRNQVFRAYLAQVEYGEKRDLDIALCVALRSGGNEKFAEEIASIFRRMFGSHEHLDILFLSNSQEIELRKVCSPFFSSSRFESPDFYLTSSEGYGLEEIRACYKERRFMNGHPDGYLLCEVSPPIVGQTYGLGGDNIHRIVLASRHAGYSIFIVNDWPIYVHVARLTCDVSGAKFIIAENEIESIGMAEIYESSVSAQASVG